MDEEFNLECLRAHNELRDLHKAPHLNFSIQLGEEAQSATDRLAKKLTQRKSTSLYGENKYSSKEKLTGEDVTLKWYKEIFEYKFGQERQIHAAICHFAQVVWNDTSEAGFGRSKSKDGQWIIIGYYRKPGNIVGKFLHNIHETIIGWENHPIIKKLLNYQSKNNSFKEPEYLETPVNKSGLTGKIEKTETFERYRNRSDNLYKDEPDFVNINKGVSKNSQTQDTRQSISESMKYNDNDEHNNKTINSGQNNKELYNKQSSQSDKNERPKKSNKIVVEKAFYTIEKSDKEEIVIKESVSKLFRDQMDTEDIYKDFALENENPEIENFRKIILKEHNKYRKLHNVKILKINYDLTFMAQKWAQKSRELDQLGYSNQLYKESQIGENITMYLSNFIEDLVQNWYSEEVYFQYGIEPNNAYNFGHFTQIVWAETAEIGIGISIISNKCVIVCFYYPPGNIQGQFKTNVLQPTTN